MVYYLVKQNKGTGIWLVWNTCFECIEAEFMWEADARKLCEKLNKKAGA